MILRKIDGISFHDKQIEAITGAAENGIEIITGGPGTRENHNHQMHSEIFLSVRARKCSWVHRQAERPKECLKPLDVN